MFKRITCLLTVLLLLIPFSVLSELDEDDLYIEEWIETDETEPILSAYDVLREGDVC